MSKKERAVPCEDITLEFHMGPASVCHFIIKIFTWSVAFTCMCMKNNNILIVFKWCRVTYDG